MSNIPHSLAPHNLVHVKDTDMILCQTCTRLFQEITGLKVTMIRRDITDVACLAERSGMHFQHY